jgi:hypothetical protein
MKTSLELISGYRKAFGKPGTHLWMKKSLNLPLDEEELANHLRMNKSLDLIPG